MVSEKVKLALIVAGIVALALAIAPHLQNINVDTNIVATAKMMMPGKMP